MAAAAGAPPPDVVEIQRDQLANEPVSVHKFTGDEAAAIIDEHKSSKISLDNFSFVAYCGWT